MSKRKTKAEIETDYRAKIQARDDELRGLRGEVRELRRMVARVKKERDAMRDFDEVPVDHRAVYYPRANKAGVHKAAFVLALGDWHVEEEVLPESVNGMNSYTPEEAQARVERVFQNTVKMLHGHRTGWNLLIEDAFVPLLGDFFSGWIHEDLQIVNHKTPQEAVIFVFDLLRAGLDFLLQESGLRRIILPCHYGNHGRGTKKRASAAAARTSWETMIYRLLSKHYDGEDRLEFRIAEGPWLYTEVYGHTFRTGHGDDINYHNGTGGVLIPLRRAVFMNLNPIQHADTTIVGHFHQDLFDQSIVVNNSLIGQTIYSTKFGPSSPPSQASFLIDEKTSRRVGHFPVWGLE